MNHEDWKKGMPVPEKYRNRLYSWEGGGYDGCLWEMNYGVVSDEGHWMPIFSTGRNGLDVNAEYSARYRRLKTDGTFGRKLAELNAWKTDELDEIFMDQVEYQRHRDPDVPPWRYHGEARDRWTEYDLGDGKLKETCRRFCDEHGGNAAVMCRVLDVLSEMKYDVWCTCSDCGEQFRPEYEGELSDLVDDDAYHGDGGVGLVYTRVLCHQCRELTRCPKCGRQSVPNPRAGDAGHVNYTFRQRIVMELGGVCDYCADGFYDEYPEWADKVDEAGSEIDRLNESAKKYLAHMKEVNKVDDEHYARLQASAKEEVDRKTDELMNDLRDGMGPDVQDYSA